MHRAAGGSNSSCAAMRPCRGDDAALARHPRLGRALELIERSFGNKAAGVTPKDTRRLRARSEQVLGAREEWDVALARELFDALLARAATPALGRSRTCVAEPRRLLPAPGLRASARCMAHRAAVAVVRRRDSVCDRRSGVVRVVDAVAARGRRPRRRCADAGARRDRLPRTDRRQAAQAAVRSEQGRAGRYDAVVRVARAAARRTQGRAGRAVDRAIAEAGGRTLCAWALRRIGAPAVLRQRASVVPAEVATGWLDALFALDWKQVEPAAFAAAELRG